MGVAYVTWENHLKAVGQVFVQGFLSGIIATCIILVSYWFFRRKQ